MIRVEQAGPAVSVQDAGRTGEPVERADLERGHLVEGRQQPGEPLGEPGHDRREMTTGVIAPTWSFATIGATT